MVIPPLPEVITGREARTDAEGTGIMINMAAGGRETSIWKQAVVVGTTITGGTPPRERLLIRVESEVIGKFPGMLNFITISTDL